LAVGFGLLVENDKVKVNDEWIDLDTWRHAIQTFHEKAIISPETLFPQFGE